MAHTVTPSRRVAFMPTSALSSMVQACMVEEWPACTAQTLSHALCNGVNILQLLHLPYWVSAVVLLRVLLLQLCHRLSATALLLENICCHVVSHYNLMVSMYSAYHQVCSSAGRYCGGRTSESRSLYNQVCMYCHSIHEACSFVLTKPGWQLQWLSSSSSSNSSSSSSIK